MKEEINQVKKQLEEVRNDSITIELLRDQRKQNKRLFIIILILIVCWFLTGTYLIYIMNDIGVIETYDTIDIDNVEQIDNSHIKIGDDTWEKSN